MTATVSNTVQFLVMMWNSLAERVAHVFSVIAVRHKGDI